MKKLRVRPDALRELFESAEYYDAAREGLGKIFLDDVQEAFHLIKEFPECAPLMKKEEEYRRCTLRKFPYGVIYVIRGDNIQVIRVADLRRHPYYWER